jgi:hypothetical protein
MQVLPWLTVLALSLPQTAGVKASKDVPLLVVLAPSGQTRGGLPVYHRHPDPARVEAVLTGGFSGRLLRLFRAVQQFRARRDGTPIEPAYLLLSTNEGGFPRVGFWLGNERKDGVGYVDLHERSNLSGRFGALDQIFPHELLHVIVHQLTGQPPPGVSGSNQVHAIGVHTDRVTAFDEGFAEHAQVLAVDDPDAAPETGALAADAALEAWAGDRLSRYARALEARWALAPPIRLGFLLWFSQAEQVLRYHAVKDNAFAREPTLDWQRLDHGGRYPAYLLENILPGTAEAAVKPASRLLSSEGVIAALFVRWLTDPDLGRSTDAAPLDDRFGVTTATLAPIERTYLKLFSVMAERHTHDAAALIRGYVETFPEEAGAVADLVRKTGFPWPLPDAPEIWLANDQFMTGTTLFDQYRAVPRVHTFDLNSASTVDLLTVEGVSMPLATAIQRDAPYVSVDDVARVPGVTGALVSRFRHMRQAMQAVRDANAREDIESVNLERLIRPALVRAAMWILVGAIFAGWLYARVRRLGAWRLGLNGLAASAFGLLSAWILGAALRSGSGAVDPALFLFLPVLGFGVPAALWQIAWRRSPREAGRVLAAWTAACLPAVAIAVPLF